MSNDAGICAATCRLWYGLSLLSGTYLSDWRRRGKDFSTDIVFDGIKSACTGCPTDIIVVNGIMPVVVVAGLVVDEVLVVVVVVIAAVLSDSPVVVVVVGLVVDGPVVDGVVVLVVVVFNGLIACTSCSRWCSSS